MSEKIEIIVGATVTFKSGRSGTAFTAKVTGFDGMYAVTEDAAGKVRKARKGGCTVVA